MNKAEALKACDDLSDYLATRKLVGPTTQPDRTSPFYQWWKAQTPKPASGVYVFRQLEDAFMAGQVCGRRESEEDRIRQLDSQFEREGG